MQREENVTPGLVLHTRWDASLSPHPSGPTGLTREEDAEAWEVWRQGQPPAPETGSRSQAERSRPGHLPEVAGLLSKGTGCPQTQAHCPSSVTPCQRREPSSSLSSSLGPSCIYVTNSEDRMLWKMLYYDDYSKWIYLLTCNIYIQRGVIVSARFSESLQSEHTQFKN